MNVYLDDVALALPNASLAEVLDAARDRAQAAGRLVVEVLFDGRRATDAELASLSEDVGVGDVREIRCRTADPAELIAATLEDAAKELELLIPDQKRACEKLWTGRVGETMDLLRDILERWKLVRGALEQCAQALSMQIQAVPAGDGRTAMDLTNELARDLDAIRRELGGGRMVELADILGYDLCNRGEDWRSMLTALAGSVRELAAADGGQRA